MASYITTKGALIVTGRLIGTTPTQAEPKYFHWGTGSTSAAASDETLSNPSATETRVTGSSSQATVTTTDDTYQLVATITAEADETITNVATFDASTSAPATILTQQVLTTDTEINVASYSGFPDSGSYDVQLLSEVMTVTSGAGTLLWQVTRGANGSTHDLSTIPNTTPVIGGSGTSGGNIFFKSSISGVPLNEGDSVTWTVNATFAS